MLINRTNLNFLFIGNQVRKTHENSYKLWKLNYNNQIFFQRIINLSSIFQQVITRIGGQFRKLSVSLLFLVKLNKSVHPIALPKMRTVFRSGLTIGIWSLWENSTHRKIRESLLGSAGVGSCPSLRKRCTFGLDIQQAGIYVPNTELELIKFRPFPFRELVWHLSTQVNVCDLAA